MLIFNTTYKVSLASTSKWLDWMKSNHIPFMLSDKILSNAQIAKIVGSEDEEGTSYSVQFHVESMDKLMEWHRTNASSFQNSFQHEFGTEVQFFSTVLELID